MRTKRLLLCGSLLVAIVAGVIILRRLPEEKPQSRPPTDADAIKDEFLAIASTLEASSNPYLGRAQVKGLQAALETTAHDPQRKIELYKSLAFQHLRLGDVQAAQQAIDEAMRLTTQPSPALLRTQAITHLRQAEVENCIRRHNRDCCIFPLSGGGAHTSKLPAERARDALSTILKAKPDDLASQWLLNVVAMALDDYPQGVPEALRIPPASLKAEYDIGRFVDVAPALGVATFNLCGGVIIEDFDGDGYLDIVTSTSDPRESLTYYRNAGNGQFQDETSGSGLDAQLGGLNCIGADYDNDGDIDVLVLRGAWLEDDGKIRNSLLRNNGVGPQGRVTFSDVTREVGIAEPASPCQAAAWGDFDGDGDLDLFVANESRVDVARDKGGDFPCQLFRNNGMGVDGRITFTDIATAAGVTNNRFCKGVTAGDFDNDGDLDLYLSNVGRNRLYRNNGPTADASVYFTDVAKQLGVQAPSAYSFAPWFFDFNNDGWLDIFVAAYRADISDLMADARDLPHQAIAPCLYLNHGSEADVAGQFVDVARQVGLDHPYLPMGANFGDLDNDGFLDVYLATGEPSYAALMPNVVLRNDAARRFQNVTFSGGLGHLQKGHGVAFADLDHDGDQDLYNQLGGFYPGDKFHNALFVNPGHNNRFLVIQLTGTKSNLNAIGARIEVLVRTPGGKQQAFHRAVGSVSSFGGSPLSRQEIGLGAAESVESVTIIWPNSASKQMLKGVALNSMIHVVEGSDRFEVIPRKKLNLAP